MSEYPYMIYGAYGYTARLLVEAAAAAGDEPLLAGRDPQATAEIAGAHGMDHVVFGLDHRGALDDALGRVDAVAHMAGPYSATVGPMVDACLRTGTHYTDISGEIDSFDVCFARHDAAVQAGISLVPGAGMDVVPTDCLAVMLAGRVDSPQSLEMGIAALPTRVGPGSAKTSVETLPEGGRAMIGGVMTRVPGGWKARQIPFPHGTHTGVTFPAAELTAIHRSTGIPDITTYLKSPRATGYVMRIGGWLAPLLRRPGVQTFLKKQAAKAKGATAEERATGSTEVWEQVTAADGTVVSGTLVLPQAHTLTVAATHAAVQRLAAGTVPPGAWTPAQAFGAEFVTTLPGVTLHLDGAT